ncbi:MAG: hypothetical protein ABL925_19005 [Methylococcales bacterium]
MATEINQQMLPETVQHDPFKKPAILSSSPAAQSISTSDKERESALSGLNLTATLRAGKNSMIILEGKTLKLGDMYEGFRLLRIDERSALFSKGKKQFILKLDTAGVATPL